MKIEKQSVGEIFKEVRKEKGLTLEEISKETNIPKRYLEAIEEDNFSVFSSETYAIGFISTYCDALEIDKEIILNQYRRLRKIEEDSPIEVLVGEKKLDFKKFIFPASIGITSVLVVIFLLILIKSQINKGNVPKTFYFSSENLSKIYDMRFKIGDKIYITNELRKIEISLDTIDKGNNLNFKIDNNAYSIKGSGVLTIDSDYDGTNDMNIEFFSTKPSYIRMNISYLSAGDVFVQSTQISNLVDAIVNNREWYRSNNPKEIVMKIFASDKCWIAYRADDKEEKNISLSEKGEQIILFSKNLTLYYGNSGAIKISIEGKEETLGNPGEVGKSVFYWSKKDKDFVLMQSVLK
ncbi:MAG: helix-turn-helix domain-containing protein [Brevinematia bacterium]